MNVVEMLTEKECQALLPRRFTSVYADEKEVIECMMLAAKAMLQKNAMGFERAAQTATSLKLVRQSSKPTHSLSSLKVSRRLRERVEAYRNSEKKDEEDDAFILLVDLVDALQHNQEE
jgi:hypothetical protein